MENKNGILELEKNLNSFNLKEREVSLHSLRLMLGEGKVEFSPEKKEVNLHCHTFFSYNGYGYSPSYIAWWAKKYGLFATATVDFDDIGIELYISCFGQVFLGIQ